jgi:hypothetical protein
MSKQVTISITMDSEFVKLLNFNVGLSRLRDKDELTPSQQLALTVLAEARGGLSEEVHATILPSWRPHIWVEEDGRKVKEVA